MKINDRIMKTQSKFHFIRNRITLILISVTFSSSVFAQTGKVNTDNIIRKWLDVAYATKSQAQKLDIYLPDEGEGPFPVIISIHGGAFKSGDKGDDQVTPMLQ